MVFFLGSALAPKESIVPAMPSSLCAQRAARKAAPCARGTPGRLEAPWAVLYFRIPHPTFPHCSKLRGRMLRGRVSFARRCLGDVALVRTPEGIMATMLIHGSQRMPFYVF
jgi:hypothetical protein